MKKPLQVPMDERQRQEEASNSRILHVMLRSHLTLSELDLERELLRKSVGALTATRCTCSDCGRTPLVGEQIHHYGRGELVCELCRLLRRSAPERSELVRHSEAGHTVRLRRAA